MYLNILFNQKEMAKAEFKSAGVHLAWDAAVKRWKTNAAELPKSLKKYASDNQKGNAASQPVGSTGEYWYLAQDNYSQDYPFLVEAVFSNKEELRQHILSGNWLHGYAGSEVSTFAENCFAVKANKRINPKRHIPAHCVRGSTRLTNAIDKEILEVVVKAVNYVDDD